LANKDLNLLIKIFILIDFGQEDFYADFHELRNKKQ